MTDTENIEKKVSEIKSGLYQRGLPDLISSMFHKILISGDIDTRTRLLSPLVKDLVLHYQATPYKKIVNTIYIMIGDNSYTLEMSGLDRLNSVGVSTYGFTFDDTTLVLSDFNGKKLFVIKESGRADKICG